MRPDNKQKVIKVESKIPVKPNLVETLPSIEEEEDKKEDRGICCFCGLDCNPYSQSCGRCSRKLTFSSVKPKFCWEQKDN